MHKFGAATASASATMTAAATDTNCSTRTRTGDGMLQQQSFSQQGGTVSDSNVQRLLSQMMQTAEAASKIQRQRDALAHPHPQQQQQQQEQEALMPPAASMGRLLSHSGSNQLQQQLQELASLLSLPSHISSLTANSQFSSLTGSAAAAAQAQQEPQQQQPDGTPEPPHRELHTLASLADSSTQEATAVDALLDLEFAAHDAGSFTRNRAQLAAALGRALAEGSVTAPAVQAAAKPEEQGAAATIKLEPMASPPSAAGAAVAAGRHRGGSGTGPCVSRPGTAAQPGAACAPSSASAPAAMAAAEGASACGRLQQELLALLTQQVASLAQRGPSAASELGAIPQDSAQAAAQPPAAAPAAPPVISAVPHFPCSGPQLSRAAALPEDVPILPILQTLKRQMALKQQAAAGAAAGSCAAAPPAAAGFGAAAAAGGGGLVRSDTSTFLQRLLQQNRQLQAVSATQSGGLERQQGEGRPAVRRSISTLTNSTGIAGLESHPATASAGAEACRMQQQQQQQPAQAPVVAGPYSSYLDAELLNLYAEFKTTRKQVLTIVKEAVDQGVMNSNVVRRLQQLQHMRKRATDSPSFTLGTAATQSAGAVPSGSAGGTPFALVSLGKRARDQQRGAGCAADAAAVDADAPSSKLRRTELNKASGTAAAGAADTVSGKAAGHAATEAKAEGEDMDVSAPNDSSARADADSTAAAASGADDATDATAAAAPTGEAATAADSDAQAAATPKAASAPPAAVREPTSPSADGGLLPRSIETLVLVHSLTNRVLAKAVSAKKEGCEALTRAEQFSAITASSHSSIQHLQLQNQMLQQQLQLAQLQLQAKQQQLVQVQARSQHVNMAYPQLVARVAKSVNRLVSTAHHDHLPVADRQELAAIAEDLLTACNLQ